MPARKKTCLIDGCKREAKLRGLCVGCYRTAWRHIKNSEGKVTWTDLERKGLAEKPSTKRQTAMLRKLAASK